MLLTGSISYDFAGQVQISLWSQNAHSLVEIGCVFQFIFVVEIMNPQFFKKYIKSQK